MVPTATTAATATATTATRCCGCCGGGCGHLRVLILFWRKLQRRRQLPHAHATTTANTNTTIITSVEHQRTQRRRGHVTASAADAIGTQR